MRAFTFTLAAVAFACTANDDAPDTDTDADSDTDVDTDTEPTPWAEITSDLGGALLSVTGTSASDVWTVGADDGTGPLMLHYDGTAWSRVDTETSGDLWWVWRPDTSTVWSVGEGGRVLRGDGATFTVDVLDENVTVFGVWGASTDDVWAVGGNISVGANGAAIWHRVDGTWTAMELPEAAKSQIAMYKVWGSAADDVWFCGKGGVLLHWDGESLTESPTDNTRDLFTVAGIGTDHVASVGGIGNAAIMFWDGTSWRDESPTFAPAFNGVSARGEQTLAVGSVGEVWRRGTDGVWTDTPRGRATDKDLHAVWIDPDGGVWTVGGQLFANPPILGTLVYGGEADVPAYAD